jgi:aldose sugar dehydrogenase
MRQTLVTAISAIALVACGQSAAPGETGAPGPETEAQRDSEMSLALEPVVDGLENPWSIAFLPGGAALVTEVGRGIRLVTADGELTPDLLDGAPEAYTEGQGGYLDLALAPDFETSRIVYLAFSEGTDAANRTAVYKARLSEDLGALEDGAVIFRSTDRSTSYHYGARIDFMADGTLLVGLGEGFRYMDESQNPDNYHGTIVRINPDGSIPEDNPFADGPAPAVWSYGHRNVQGLVVAGDTVYAHEHGPKGGDELNLIRAGANYGWPEITYGINYDGSIITRDTAKEGMEQPLSKWVPSIAPCGMAMATTDTYPGWKGDLFIGAMEGPAGLKLVRVDLEDGEVVGREDLLVDEGLPIRDVVEGPDGSLYIITKQLDGAMYKLVME